MKNIKVDNGRAKSAINEYDLDTLIQYINSSTTLHAKRDRAMILLSLSNGLRVNEIASTCIEDLGEMDGKRILWLLRKGYQDKSNFTVLSPKVYNLIIELIGDRTTGAIFQGRAGANIKTDSVSRIIREIFKSAGIKTPSISPHSLRHTCAVTALKAGADVVAIQKMLNHKSLQTTSIYLSSFNRLENPAELMIDIDF